MTYQTSCIYKQDNCSFHFVDSDVVNIDDFIPAGEYNPHNVRPWLLHDHGFAIAVVFADCLQDAIDIAVDENKMDRYLISDKDMSDYPVDDQGCHEGVSYLGNAGEPFDIDTLGAVELPNPKYSFCAMFNSHVG